MNRTYYFHKLDSYTTVLRIGHYSILLPYRAMLTCLFWANLLLLLASVALMAGNSWLSPAQLWDGLQSHAGPSVQLLLTFRYPRILLAILAGAALGLSGNLLQTLSHNRLATPEMLGLSDGAGLAILGGLLFSNSGLFGPWWLGPFGAFAAAGLLFALTYKLSSRGEILLINGLALGYLLRAFFELVLSRQELLHANIIYTWSQGSLNGRELSECWPVAIGLMLGSILMLLLTRHIRLLHFDAELSQSLGLSRLRIQWLLILCAVGLAGLAIGATGPLAFIALSAPFLAERLTNYGHSSLTNSALAGACLVVGADLLGRSLLSSAELPVGIVCKLLGGPLLLWLLLSKS